MANTGHRYWSYLLPSYNFPLYICLTVAMKQRLTDCDRGEVDPRWTPATPCPYSERPALEDRERDTQSTPPSPRRILICPPGRPAAGWLPLVAGWARRWRSPSRGRSVCRRSWSGRDRGHHCWRPTRSSGRREPCLGRGRYPSPETDQHNYLHLLLS